jgi:hypothetical protein
MTKSRAKDIGSSLVLLVLPFLGAGCVRAQKWILEYEMTADEAPCAAVCNKFAGVQEMSQNPQERKAVMKAFYEKDHDVYEGILCACLSMIQDKVEFLDKSETRCDILLTGRTFNFVQSLMSLVAEKDKVRIVQEKGKVKVDIQCDFSLRVLLRPDVLQIKSDVPFRNHNADETEDGGRVLRWHIWGHEKRFKFELRLDQRSP